MRTQPIVAPQLNRAVLATPEREAKVEAAADAVCKRFADAAEARRPQHSSEYEAGARDMWHAVLKAVGQGYPSAGALRVAARELGITL